jgi:MOSC domain-containing protein YiiM
VAKIIGRTVSVHAGPASGFSADLSKPQRGSIEVLLDGIVGDRHQSFQRTAWAGDKQPEGTARRNERQWSAISLEELAEISATMDLSEPLSAASVGVNLCFEGISELSRLPKGTTLKFPSGAELIVEEYNPPCQDMSKQIAAQYATNSGKPLLPTAFSKAAKLTRGIVGVVEVAGVISAGDEVAVELYEPPSWLARSGG